MHQWVYDTHPYSIYHLPVQRQHYIKIRNLFSTSSPRKLDSFMKGVQRPQKTLNFLRTMKPYHKNIIQKTKPYSGAKPARRKKIIFPVVRKYISKTRRKLFQLKIVVKNMAKKYKCWSYIYNKKNLHNTIQ